MVSPLNGPLEVGVRVLMLLTEAFPQQLDLNRLVLLDHGLLHSADLGGPASLHPPLPIRSGELGVKRKAIEDGLELLVRAELVAISAGEAGIEFGATDNADSFLRVLISPYSEALKSRAEWVVRQFGNLEDDDLRSTMRSVSAHWAEEFEPGTPLIVESF